MRQSCLYIDGAWVATQAGLPVHDKYGGGEVARVGLAGPAEVEAAVAAARRVADGPEPSPYQRWEILSAAAALLRARRAEAVEAIVAETGFTLRDAEADFTRAIETMTLSAEEAKRITGEMVPIQGAPGQRPERLAFTLRSPVGVVCAITPFNSPLNTVLHKIAPAFAAGNAVVLKPASYTPLSALLLCEVMAEAGMPAGWLNLVIGGGATVGQRLLDDPRIDYYTFTGSTEVGRRIQAAAGLRRTQLELGNISSVVVAADAALELAAQKCAQAAFRKAGQVCTSVQRILVEAPVAERFADLLLAATAALPVGDPRAPGTVVGPMIDVAEAERAEAWVDEALSAGAEALTGPRREGPLLWPTILRGVPPDARVLTCEVFAPVVALVSVPDFASALDLANATPFGLAGGVFTNDVTRALVAARKMRMGTVHINDTSSSRVDLMPYGGLKDSGFGHEGPRYAVRDMTEERLITLNPV